MQGVNRATKDLFATVKTPQQMLDLGEEALLEHIKTIGLFRQKAKNVMKLSRMLVDDYAGEVPSSRAALMTLPGVGRKTANVVLNSVFHCPRRPSTPISSASATAPASRPAAMSTRSSARSRTISPRPSSRTPITG
jgi:transposase